MRKLLLRALRAVCPSRGTYHPLELSAPRSIADGTWSPTTYNRAAPGRWAAPPEEEEPRPTRRTIRRGLRSLAVAALLCGTVPAIPPVSQFITIGGESGLVQVVSAAYYSVHGDLDEFSPSAVHESTSDRLNLAGQLVTHDQRKRYANFALHEKRWAALVLEAHYYTEGFGD